LLSFPRIVNVKNIFTDYNTSCRLLLFFGQVYSKPAVQRSFVLFVINAPQFAITIRRVSFATRSTANATLTICMNFESKFTENDGHVGFLGSRDPQSGKQFTSRLKTEGRVCRCPLPYLSRDDPPRALAARDDNTEI
jgi:hypothetical protein